jgi:predicted nucleic-acid-binding protein
VKGLDTNVLVRYLVRDDEAQFRKAARVVEGGLMEDDLWYVSVAAVLELVWVLGSSYEYSNFEIADAVQGLLQADRLLIQHEKQVSMAVFSLRAGTGSFGDVLIGAIGEWAGCTSTLTFDRKAARLAGFELM